jgi:hypothetical protein
MPMKEFAILLLATGASALFAQPANSLADAPATSRPSAELTPAAILATTTKVADWQLVQTNRHKTDDWTYGALYAGMMALSQIADSPKYHDAMMEMGRKQDWKPARRIYHADDHCVCQTY